MIKKSHSLFLALVLCSSVSKADLNDKAVDAAQKLGAVVTSALAAYASVYVCSKVLKTIETDLKSTDRFTDEQKDIANNSACALAFLAFMGKSDK